MKLKVQLLSLTILMLIAASAASAFSVGRSSRKLASSEKGHEEIFIIYRNDNGEAVCREADDSEQRRILNRRAEGLTRLIYSGAPLRTQIGNAEKWTEFRSGLSLQPSAGLHIVLHGTTQLDQNPQAKNAFIIAANIWTPG